MLFRSRTSPSKKTGSLGQASSPSNLPPPPDQSMELTVKGAGAFGELEQEGLGETGRSQLGGGGRGNGAMSGGEGHGVSGARRSSSSKESRRAVKGVSQASLPSSSTRGHQYASSSYSASSAPTTQHRISSRNTIPYNVDSRSSAFGSASQQAPAAGPSHSQASRFLLTVVPPMHLPHDPPHPRTSQACSGYGPPENFR